MISPTVFDLFRLNIVDEAQKTLPHMGEPLRGDSDLLKVLDFAASKPIVTKESTAISVFDWRCTDFALTETPSGALAHLLLVRSTLQQIGQTVTREGLSDAEIQLMPPQATAISMLFYMKRHIVAVEHNPSLMRTDKWRTQFHSLMDISSSELDRTSSIRIEPIPRDQEILKAFRSFSKLTRLRVRLRIANPELSRYAQHIQKTMADSGIRDYTQDMRNPGGINQSQTQTPYASAELAQAGYREGEVIMEGFRDDRPVKLRTGKHPQQVFIDDPKVSELRHFVRGLSSTAKSKEGQGIARSVLAEIDRIAPPPMDDAK